MEVQNYLIVEKSSFGFKKCGCYVMNQEILDLHNAPVSVPLKNIDYQLEICNSVCRVILEQVYVNPTDKYLELEYSTPIDEKVCIYKFNAVFGETEIEGIVKQKEQAQKEYKEAVSQGKEAAIGKINDKQPDIFDLKIGNVAPKSEVKIKIQYLYDLKVNLNMFWKIILESKIWPRYTNSEWKNRMVQQNKLKVLDVPDYTWSFKVVLNTSQQIALAESTTHKLKQIVQNENRKQKVFVLEQGQIPNKDFIFIYTTENFSKPTSVYSKTDTSQTLLVSFIPRFNDLELSDAERMQQEGKDYEVSTMNCKGQFIFLFDRSGSMSGSKVKDARKALLFFLKSLPSDSYFNIISFGSTYQFLYKESIKTTNQTIKQACWKIDQFKADLGGTNILDPLNYVFSKQKKIDYPQQIFLLTDGQVDNTKKVLSLIKKQSKYSTVHGIGIGQSCSRQLIQGCKDTQRGQYIFIHNSEDSSAKIIELLERTLSPAITNFVIQYNEKQIQAVIPNPKQMPYILKNDPLNLYFIFKGTNFEGNFNIGITYTDPVTKKSVKHNITSNIPTQPNFGFLDKKAQHTKLSLICSSIDSNHTSKLLFAKPEDIKQYAIKQSIKHQIICPLTAFVCINKSAIDSKLQQIKDIGSVSVIVPQAPQTKIRKLKDLHNQSSKHDLMIDSLLQQIDRCKSSQSSYNYLQKASVQLCSSQKQCKKKSVGSSISSALKRGAESIAQTFGSIGNFFKSKPNNNKNVDKKQSSVRKQQKEIDDMLCFADFQQSVDFCRPSAAPASISPISISPASISPNTDNILLSLQNMDGSWNEKDSLEIITSLSLSQIKFKQLVIKYKHASFVLTILIIRYLELNNDSKFSLILKKAKQWSKLKSKQWSITQQNINDIQSIF